MTKKNPTAQAIKLSIGCNIIVNSNAIKIIIIAHMGKPITYNGKNEKSETMPEITPNVVPAAPAKKSLMLYTSLTNKVKNNKI